MNQQQINAKLAEMETRAQRHLDGMVVNRDEMAKDVIQLVAALRRAQSAVHRPGDDPFGWFKNVRR